MDQRIIVPKWQKKWAEAKLFESSDKSNKPKFYNLEMFPYPSAYGLHMGHVRNYSIGDTIARYKRMRGFNVLYPMGFDAFGLPAENAAIKNKTHPRVYTEKAIDALTSSMKRLGLSYDWNRTLATCYPEYYKWNQLFFLKFMEKGLTYRKNAPINWCPSCKTVLANEQVVDNKCWRCESTVEIKDLEQWFFRITKYAEELLDSVDSLNWPERIKTMQRNWIGKSSGTQIDWKVKDTPTTLTVFTTRPDTIFGVSCLVIAPEHPIVAELVKGKPIEKEVQRFVNNVVLQEKFTRAAEDKEKEGMFLDCYAIHPFTGKEIPIYIANFVLMDYGTGVIMAVPAHDTRDYAFAKKYNLPITQVIKSAKDHKLPFVDDGVLIDSGEFTGVESTKAQESITKSLEQKKIGRATTNYKIRDWLLSRQRYWGTPIPVVYCAKCGIVPVPEKELPILLPEKAEFTGQGNPLANNPDFVNTHCPKCKGAAKRETDTMDTFVDSSWYYLRYISPKDLNKPFDKDAVKYWMPVNQYIGGAEHAVSHLLFARFFCKALRDLGFIDIDEPFQSLFNQGVVHKDGKRMSKSQGNVVSQEEVEESYGIDTARLYLTFVASPGKDIEWSDEGAQGSYRFVQKLESLFEKKHVKADKATESKVHSMLKSVTHALETFELNKALLVIMDCVEYLDKKGADAKSLEYVTLALAPFIPHIAEELWEKLGKKPFACTQDWPAFDEKKINPVFDYEDTLISSTLADIRGIITLKKMQPAKITLFVADDWKYDVYTLVRSEFEKTKDFKTILTAIMKTDLKKHGEFITKQLPKLLAEPGKMPSFLLGQKKETEMLTSAIESFEKELKCKVEIHPEQKSGEPKAKMALPGKVAILIS